MGAALSNVPLLSPACGVLEGLGHEVTLLLEVIREGCAHCRRPRKEKTIMETPHSNFPLRILRIGDTEN